MIISTLSTELDHAVFAMLCSQGWRLIFSLPSMLGRPFPDDDDKFFFVFVWPRGRAGPRRASGVGESAARGR
jgi:hypothetical protein